MAKIKVDIDLISMIFPEAKKLEYLPRKKKKALKKRISKRLTDFLSDEAHTIIEKVTRLREEMTNEFAKVREELDKIEQKNI